MAENDNLGAVRDRLRLAWQHRLASGPVLVGAALHVDELLARRNDGEEPEGLLLAEALAVEANAMSAPYRRRRGPMQDRRRASL
ncbi:hypothetical protein [Methylobacterium indicum]|uniref:hypothetical protein n=1 Tax=Methylobacterium indicum TaxID=1775910 RepID=UPI0024355787|nr:hypothetical protein [Methylobacterium indicum]